MYCGYYVITNVVSYLCTESGGKDHLHIIKLYNTLHMITKIELSNTIAFNTIMNGGYTTDLDGNRPVDGFMVSCHKQHELTLDLDDVKADINLLISLLQSYMREHEALISQSNNLYIGTWIDKGMVYIDISTKVAYPTVANRLAVQHQQIEFYGVKCGESYKTVYPDSIEKVEVHRYAPELSKIHLIDGTVIPAGGVGLDYSFESLAELIALNMVNNR